VKLLQSALGILLDMGFCSIINTRKDIRERAEYE